MTDELLFGGPKRHFTIGLTPLQVRASHVDLPADFGDYLQQGKFKNIVLHGPQKTVKCKLLLRNTPKKSNKIGSGWKQFFTIHGLDETLDLVFEVDEMKCNQHVKVLTYSNY
ncbi:hypothetical protein DEO72_LG3g2210 [Vigna unguiculata]|uniref:TF-B3 domain-containing protein n=1 Tax=Vigna unguiculata TaxID=3917 RepID=A0A4D6LGG2_VIGUN|nr:hypothetical protein DEO72_LG3g2210 [Vigna unguiculata]